MTFFVSEFAYFLAVCLFVSSGGFRGSNGARFVAEPNDKRVKTGANVTLAWIYEDPDERIEKGELLVSHDGGSTKILFRANPNTNRTATFLTQELAKRAHVGLSEPLKLGNVSVQIILLNVTTADTGVYTFKVTRLLVKLAIESNVSLYVTEKPHSLQINSTGSISKEVGESLYIKCQVLGAPVPEVTWFSGSSELQSGNGVAILSLNKITQGTKGLYICKGNNTEGEVQDSIFVNVTYRSTAKPTPTGDNNLNTNRSTAKTTPTGDASLISYSVTLLTALQLITSMM